MPLAVERLAGRLTAPLRHAGSHGSAFAAPVSSRPAGLTAVLPTTGCCWRQRQQLFSTTSVASASSNSRWTARQSKDRYAREAKVQGLKSRAAFKLLEMDAKYRLFRPGQMVVDLGYAPGSWSQVAMERTKPSGRVLGIDLIPAQPPRGVSTIQGNFLAPTVRELVKDFLATSSPARTAAKNREPKGDADVEASDASEEAADIALDQPSYLQMGQQKSSSGALSAADTAAATARDGTGGRRTVDVVLSDMSEPWPQTYGFWLNTLSNPYARMMNTSGTPFRDHAGSMDLCAAALEFASDTLRPGGHFVCKFYQGGEDKALEARLRKMFAKVHREKPESSRSESKEAYFVALRRKSNVKWEDLD